MFKSSEGKKVPDVKFRTRREDVWADVSSKEIFEGKNVIVFSLPGAFTPTCSSTHVPGYNHLAARFKSLGVDEIVCVSVNDAFVMDAWKADQEAEHLTFLPDGNGEFSEGMGLLVDKGELGFGKRSWRYSMYVENGVVKKMFIEPEEPGDPFKVSDAETMLKYLNPEATKDPQVTIFTKPGCPYCVKAKELLKQKGLAYEEIPLSKSVTTKTLQAVAGRNTVPQVFIDGKHIGGSEDLEKHLSELSLA